MSAPHPSFPEALQGLRALLDSAGACIYVKDARGAYVYVNAALCALFGRPEADILGRDVAEFVDIARSRMLDEGNRRVLEQGEVLHDTEELVLPDGTLKAFWTLKAPVRDARQRVVGLCGMSIDVSANPLVADELIARNQLLNTVLANVDAHVYAKAHDGRYLFANQKVADLYGHPVKEILGRHDAELLDADVAARLGQVDALVLSTGQRQTREEIVIGADGVERHFWSVKLPLKLPGQAPGVIGFSSDITELLQLKQSLRQKRLTDELTGLPNRAQFEAELEVALRLAAHEAQTVAVLLLDLDRFKDVNTSLGQALGDQLLQQVAERLRRCDWVPTHLARVSGDEFAMGLGPGGAVDDLPGFAERLRQLMAEPFVLLGREHVVTISIGISLFPADGASGPELLGRAEAAMYDAKDKGRDQHRFYSHALGASVATRIALERELRAALSQAQFELHYQPKLRCSDGGVAGVEALMRWNRPGHGMVPPAVFIPVAEQLGLLVQMGDWAIEQACRQSAAWVQAGLPRVPIAVNLSPSQLTQASLVDRVAALLAAYGLGEGALEMEVTESMMMDDPEQAIAMLRGLRGLGVHLSIDDFGTGYSSMAYLQRLPVGTLKLDRFFVREVDTDARAADLCAGVIALAHKLGLLVVAEGVETEAQRHALAARDCDQLQGYLFSKPLPAAEATAFLRAHQART